MPPQALVSNLAGKASKTESAAASSMTYDSFLPEMSISVFRRLIMYNETVHHRTSLLTILLFGLLAPCFAQQRPDLQVARDTAKWLNTVASQTKDGVVWPADPSDSKSVNTTLYAGTPGPILFYLELYRYTGEREYLCSARSGADALLNSIDGTTETGLYEGLAGIGFTLGQAYLITHDVKYRDGTLRVVKLLHERAKPAGKGIEWNDTTDVIAGASGTGLFLLWADEHLHAPGAKHLANQAGEHLLDLAQREGEGRLKWMIDSKNPREYPNFSHGTAGVAYFLASLYQQTRGRKFLDAAIAGANYLLSIANTEGEYCFIYHDSDNKNLYYLSWCHGPAGTARLFYRLYQATKSRKWLAWTKKSAQSLINSGAPDRVVTPGDWNNISVCCGVTGQAQFFLSMYQILSDRQYLNLARKASALLINKAIQDLHGARWVQAETRVRPDVVLAQTGYMQGASGVGMWLLHLHQFLQRARKPVITFPDNPFLY